MTLSYIKRTSRASFFKLPLPGLGVVTESAMFSIPCLETRESARIVSSDGGM